MPIVTPQRKKQRNLIIIFGFVLVTIVSLLYLGVFRKGGITTKGGGNEAPFLGGEKKLEIKFDAGLFKDEKFRSLTPYAKISHDIKTGRDNPFLPY